MKDLKSSPPNSPNPQISYNKYLVKSYFQLPPASSLNLDHRKRIFYASVPVKNQKILKLFQKAYHRLRCVLAWKFKINELKDYGTGSSLFSATFAYKNNIQTVMDQKKLVNKDEYTIVKDSSKLRLFHPNDLVRQLWNTLIFVLVVYSLLVIPMMFAFPGLENELTMVVFERVVDLLFVFDMIIQINTVYIDENKIIIRERSKILRHYVKFAFAVDFLSIFPFWVFDANHLCKYFRLIRLIKLKTLTKALKFEIIIKALRLTSLQRFLHSVEGLSRLFGGLIIVIIMTHCISCIMNLSAYIDDFHPDTWLVRVNLAEAPTSKKYLAGLYFAFTVLMTVGFGDIYAQTKNEMVICIIWEFVGIGFYSFVFGSITSLLTALDQKNAAFASKLQKIDLFSEDANLPPSLQKLILKEVQDSSANLMLGYDEKLSLVKNLPKKLRYEICAAMYGDAAKKIYFFQDKPLGFVADIIPRLIYRVLKDKELVYKKNDFSDAMYFIITGKASFVFGKDNLVFKSMLAGSHFGEIELIEKKQRDFGVITVGVCEFLEMPKFVLELMLVQYPVISEAFIATAALKKAKIDTARNDIIELLMNVDVKREKTINEIAGTSKSYESRDFDLPRSSSRELKHKGYLYGLEYQNKYLKQSTAQIKKDLDSLDIKLKMILTSFNRN